MADLKGMYPRGRKVAARAAMKAAVKKAEAQGPVIEKKPEEKLAEKGQKGTGQRGRVVSRIASGGEAFAGELIAGATGAKRFKGIRHPDSLIDPKMADLYLPTKSRATPTGQFVDDPRDLYFGTSRKRRR